MNKKSMSRCAPFSIAFFDGCLMICSSISLSSWNAKSQLKASGLAFSWFSRFNKEIDSEVDFGLILASFYVPKTTKNPS